MTNDAALADRVRRLRNGGQTRRYQHEEFGVNSRLDEVQAAILRERLTFLPAWTAKRRALAHAYREALATSPVVVPPECDPGHVYHLFPVRSTARDALQAHLAGRGVATLVHYPMPIPRQPALSGTSPHQCPVADRVCNELCSLPIYPSLPIEAVRDVAAAVHDFVPTATGDR
jgi:dTDP-3-amino-3,4,6-trideoxy-alpha-D-glucose transaminase